MRNASLSPRRGDDGAPPYARQDWLPPGKPHRDYQPVVVPNGSKLAWKVVDGVKVFHMVAEEVEHEFAPGLKATCWGYNGQVHGPTIEVVEGDRVRFYVTNLTQKAICRSILWPTRQDVKKAPAPGRPVPKAA
jgi:hypothetical protein